MTTVKKIQQTIKGTEFEGKCFIAGGWVRDLVMGNKSKDIDIVVELPDGGIKLANFLSEKLNGTNVVIFERFGTAQVVIDGEELEFVMTRKESYIEGSRKPTVEFGTILDDVHRRDFTINSMLFDITNEEILDLTGMGMKDIKDKIIRTTSDAESIFSEDPLRMLRAIRFSAKLGFDIEASTFEAIIKSASTITNISCERIQDEFMKILASDRPTQGIVGLIQTGLFEPFLPELKLSRGMSQNEWHTKDVFGHIIDVMENVKPTAIHRLAGLLHDIGKVVKRTEDETGVHFLKHEKASADITERLMKQLKFSNEEIELVVSAVDNHMRISEFTTDKKLRKIRMELGEKKFNFLLDICEGDRLSHVKPNIDVITHARNLSLTEKIIVKDKLPVTGDDIMLMFNLKPGREVGEKLDIVRELVLENPDITKEQILEKL